MGKKIVSEKKILIRNVGKVWDGIYDELTNISDTESFLAINMGQVETVDSAGLQLIIFLLSNDFPHKCQIEGLSEKIKQQLISSGFNVEKEEVKK